MSPARTTQTGANAYDAAAAAEVPSDGFDHKGYIKWRCSKHNKQMCESGDKVFVEGPSVYGPSAFCVAHTWTAEEKAAFLSNGSLPIGPVTSFEFGNPDKMLFKFAQVRGRSTDYPGHVEDLGRPVSFLGIGKPGFRCFYILEAIEEFVGGREPKWIAMVPSDIIEVSHRRMVNEDFMSTRTPKNNPILLSYQIRMPDGRVSIIGH